jgi:hypothetical protein
MSLRIQIRDPDLDRIFFGNAGDKSGSYTMNTDPQLLDLRSLFRNLSAVWMFKIKIKNEDIKPNQFLSKECLHIFRL